MTPQVTSQPQPSSEGDTVRERLDAQRHHWERVLADHDKMFGTAPSHSAQAAVDLLTRHGVSRLLELGGGQGRDSLFFASRGLKVTVFDYAASGLEAITDVAAAFGFGDRITAVQHDVRQPLPLTHSSFDACYSHMLMCMALTRRQQLALCSEVWRILRPGGLHVFTARNRRDPRYRKGRHHGEDLYESGGFIVHYLNDRAIDRLSAGWHRLGEEEFEEGPLPRRLTYVALQRPHTQDQITQMTS